MSRLEIDEEFYDDIRTSRVVTSGIVDASAGVVEKLASVIRRRMVRVISFLCYFAVLVNS